MSPSTASLAAATATATAAGAADLHEHRVRVSVEIRDLLRQFVEGDVPLSLTTPDGLAYSTSLWAEDAQRGVLVFAADARDTLVPRLAESHEVTATGYLDSVKVQFDVHDLLLVHGRSASAFNAQYPREVYRFQRRNAFRIRPTGRTQPHALLELAELPRRQIDLRILDISHTGVALMLNEELDLFRAGQCLSGVELVLDVATRMRVTLRVMHVSEVSALPTRHRRIGCELLMPSPAVQRELQRYLDHAQKRHRLLSL